MHSTSVLMLCRKWWGHQNLRVLPLPVDLSSMVTCTVAETYQATSVPASSGAKVHFIVLGHCSLNVTLPSLLKGSSNIDVTGLRLRMDNLVDTLVHFEWYTGQSSQCPRKVASEFVSSGLFVAPIRGSRLDGGRRWLCGGHGNSWVLAPCCSCGDAYCSRCWNVIGFVRWWYL